jgi:hypothetical protein
MESSFVKPLLLRLTTLLLLLLLLLSEAAGLGLCTCSGACLMVGVEAARLLLVFAGLARGVGASAAACAAAAACADVACLRAKGSLAGPCSGSASGAEALPGADWPCRDMLLPMLPRKPWTLIQAK